MRSTFLALAIYEAGLGAKGDRAAVTKHLMTLTERLPHALAPGASWLRVLAHTQQTLAAYTRSGELSDRVTPLQKLNRA